MYVCLCNGHTSQQLESLARSGVACVEHAYELLGGSPACRQCIDYAEAILADAGPAGSERDRTMNGPGPADAAAVSP